MTDPHPPATHFDTPLCSVGNGPCQWYETEIDLVEGPIGCVIQHTRTERCSNCRRERTVNLNATITPANSENFMSEAETITPYNEWLAEGERLFGADTREWKFVCPACKHVASVSDWIEAGADEGEIAFSCVGRHIEGSRSAFSDTGEGPCTYAGGGLFAIAPRLVESVTGKPLRAFDFASST